MDNSIPVTVLEKTIVNPVQKVNKSAKSCVQNEEIEIDNNKPPVPEAVLMKPGKKVTRSGKIYQEITKDSIISKIPDKQLVKTGRKSQDLGKFMK